MKAVTSKRTVEHNTEAGERHDFAEDPDEMDNRFDDPTLRRVRAKRTDMIRARPDDALNTPPKPVGVA